MLQNKMDGMNVSAVMLQTESSHPWGEDIWSLIGLIPGVSQQDLRELEQQGTLHIWSNLTIELHTLHCESYYHNLISGKPQVYIVCKSNTADSLSPLLITVDYDEAASYLETDEVVVQTELAAELIPWVEKFVLENYTPEKRKKRRRKKWHDGGSTS